MVDLATNYNESHVALSSIAERQGISTNYLEQVFAMLGKEHKGSERRIHFVRPSG